MTRPPRRAPALRTTVLRAGNAVVRRFAGRRLYALLQHRGRRSGRTYATPVVAWMTSAQTLVPLPYGPTTDWCRNVLADDSCWIQVRGHWYVLHAPQLLSREAALSYLPPAARTVARVVPVQTYVKFQTTAAPVADTGGLV